MENPAHANRRQTVTCSCGATCALTFTGERYYPLKAGWKFRGAVEAANTALPAGWYCGQSDHYQKSFR